jgi:hypothetical protein
MATKYTLYFSDTANKTPFDLQAYTTNGPVSPSNGTLISGASDATTTLKLWGKGLKDYGEPVFQDLIYMLENFANSTIPVNSIEGQLWYNNVGSPSTPELFIRNSNASDAYGLVGSPPTISHPGWDAVILATGSSAMTGELELAGNPTDPFHAIPLQFLDDHESDTAGTQFHLTPTQNGFMDDLIIGGSPASLQADDVNALIGITGNVQTQLDAKLNNNTNNVMFAGYNITFTGGGEVLGLPAVPSVDGAAASKKFVVDSLSGLAVGDGVLTRTEWQTTASGSPPIDPGETTLRLVVQQPGSPILETTIDAKGISRVGHGHEAVDVSIDNAFDLSYGTNVQTAIEHAAAQIDSLSGGTGGGTGTSATVRRIFESLTSDLVGGSPWQVQTHFADDNRVSITVNGVKQYVHSRGFQTVSFSTTVTDGSATGLDNAELYDFDISIDGGASTTVTVSGGSPYFGVTTHGNLVDTINAIFASFSPDLGATYSLTDSAVQFTSHGVGSASTISITPPGSPSNTYLFGVDGSPLAIVNADFYSTAPTLEGSPVGSPYALADIIYVNGDVTTDFPVGKIFTISGSNDSTYGSYDGIYSVHISGASFNGVETEIPIGDVSNSLLNIPLLVTYDPTGSPAPAVPSPSTYGDVSQSVFGGIVQVNAAELGTDGDYAETDAAGNIVQPNAITSYVVFDNTIPAGSPPTKIESLLYV